MKSITVHKSNVSIRNVQSETGV